MITFLAPALIWSIKPPFGVSFSVKSPVDSITISTPIAPQGSLEGSRSLRTLMVLPATISESSVASTVCGNLPCTESYLSNKAKLFGLPRSLMATTSSSDFFSIRARKTILPIRPKPLIPIFVAISLNLTCLKEY